MANKKKNQKTIYNTDTPSVRKILHTYKFNKAMNKNSVEYLFNELNNINKIKKRFVSPKQHIKKSVELKNKKLKKVGVNKILKKNLKKK